MSHNAYGYFTVLIHILSHARIVWLSLLFHSVYRFSSRYRLLFCCVFAFILFSLIQGSLRQDCILSRTAWCKFCIIIVIFKISKFIETPCLVEEAINQS